jgi:AcrR family transcriptional regulator
MSSPAHVERVEAAEAGGRTARKRKAILDAATTAFLQKGYLGTSMDEVATLAAVSKQTVYKHFDDKESLFSEIVLTTIADYTDHLFDDVLALQDTQDLDRDLCALARRIVHVVMQPRVLRLRRLVVGEASRFPRLGRTFFDRGPSRTIEALATAFARLAQRGLLTLEDPTLAAAHCNWLVAANPVNVAMLTGDDEPFSEEELDHFADEGARVFLAAYKPRRSK